MEHGALRVGSLDRFSLRAARRQGPFELLDRHGAVIGEVSGHPALRLHVTVVDGHGDVMFQSRSPEVFGEDAATATILDRFGGVIGSVTDVADHHFRELWIVNNAVGEPIAVVEEHSKLGALLASWKWPTARRYAVSVPAADHRDEVIAGAVIGRVRRSLLGRRWTVEITGDPDEAVARPHVLAGIAVIVMHHAA